MYRYIKKAILKVLTDILLNFFFLLSLLFLGFWALHKIGKPRHQCILIYILVKICRKKAITLKLKKLKSYNYYY